MAAPVASTPPALLVHETVVGQPSPPAAFLATVRLRRPCAVSHVVLVPAGTPELEHGPPDRVGSTPRTPTDVELLFNVRFAPPAVAPPSIRANKLQRIVIEYRPTSEDAQGRSGSQEFALGMPSGITTNLLIFRSPLPIITVLVYGSSPIPPPAPLPEPDWTTFLRLRDSPTSSDVHIASLECSNLALPALELVARGWDETDWRTLHGALTAVDSERSCADHHPLQARLDELVQALVRLGKEVTELLKASGQDVRPEGDDPMHEPPATHGPPTTQDDPLGALRLALKHLVELLLRAEDTGVALALKPSGAEAVLMAVLLQSSSSPSTLAIAADVLVALLSTPSIRGVVVAGFAAAAASHSRAESVWSLGLWATVLETSPIGSLNSADREAFAALAYRLDTANMRPSTLTTPTALLAFVAGVVQVSSVGAVLADLVHSAGSPLVPAKVSKDASGLSEEDALRLEKSVHLLHLWSVDRAPQPLCKQALATPSTIYALAVLAAHTSATQAEGAVAALDNALSAPSAGRPLSRIISLLSPATRSSLQKRLGSHGRKQLSIAAEVAHRTTFDLLETTVAHAEDALRWAVHELPVFELQLYLVHLLVRLRSQTSGRGTVAGSQARALLRVHELVNTALRDLLARGDSPARERVRGEDRMGSVRALARADAMVLRALRLALDRARAGGAERFARMTIVRPAVTAAVDAHVAGSYVASPRFLQAFTLAHERPETHAEGGWQVESAKALLLRLAETDFEAVLDALLEKALADPGVNGPSAVALLADMAAASHTRSRWAAAPASPKRQEGFALLSVYLSEEQRSDLARTLAAIALKAHTPLLPCTPPPSDLAPSIAALTALSRSSSTSPTISLALPDLLTYLHTPSLSLLSSTSSTGPYASPNKPRPRAPDSPPTSKTYKLQEFRAPRAPVVGPGAAGFGGAGGSGGKMGNVSRAPSRHVDDFESSLPPPPTAHPALSLALPPRPPPPAGQHLTPELIVRREQS